MKNGEEFCFRMCFSFFFFFFDEQAHKSLFLLELGCKFLVHWFFFAQNPSLQHAKNNDNNLKKFFCNFLEYALAQLPAILVFNCSWHMFCYFRSKWVFLDFVLTLKWFLDSGFSVKNLQLIDFQNKKNLFLIIKNFPVNYIAFTVKR